MSEKQPLHLGNLSAPRGSKGQWSRSGSSLRAGFEGGQMPLYRRVPKRGFTNIFKKVFAILNLRDLKNFKGEEKITPETLAKQGLIKKPTEKVKILGVGEITHPLEIHAHAFSRSAQTKITEAGGKFLVLTR